MLVRRRHGWELPEREATAESVFLDRRRFVATALAGSIAAAAPARGADEPVSPAHGTISLGSAELNRRGVWTPIGNVSDWRNGIPKVRF